MKFYERHDGELEKRLDKAADEFPEMYNGNGTIFRALYELKRLANRDDVKPIEFGLIAEDIENELIDHSFFNIIERTAKIEFDLGKMDEAEYDDLRNGKRKLRYST